jgi:23S rRNA (adenine2503-C2)-methyltransferase
MGLTRKIDNVSHTKMLPLEDKWVITVSTQYGCSMNCSFCDVPRVGPGINTSCKDLVNQVHTGLSLHPEVTYTNRLNIHFARMGEPTWNPNVLEATRQLINARDLGNFHLHPVVSTMMPKKNKWLREFIISWMHIKNYVLQGEAGLQLSINSTCEKERAEMFSGNACRLDEISQIMRGIIPVGRKITLNFAVADYQIDPSILLKYFHPDDYVIKLTPMHKTSACIDSNTLTKGDYTTYAPYEHYEKALVDAGYDVLVFIASKEEDEGRITCGNAILSGTRPFQEAVL